MKTNVCSGFAGVVLFVASLATAQTTQFVTIQYPKNYFVQTNQVVSVVGYDYIDKPIINSYYLLSSNTIRLDPYNGGSSIATPSAQIPQMVTGVTYVEMDSAGWATFKIETPATATVVSNYVPADAIVIPASATGNVQIILESSPDLVNWTAASPGTYGASAGTNRFFRVRAAAN